MRTIGPRRSRPAPTSAGRCLPSRCELIFELSQDPPVELYNSSIYFVTYPIGIWWTPGRIYVLYSLHCASSELSPQSSLWSHLADASIHLLPAAHRNWSSRHATVTFGQSVSSAPVLQSKYLDKSKFQIRKPTMHLHMGVVHKWYFVNWVLYDNK